MNTKISKKGFSSIIYFITQVMFLRVGSTRILNSASNGSIYSLVTGTIISLILLFPLLKLFNYEKELSLFEKIEKLYGKTIGNIINLFLVIIFMLFFIYLLWSLNSYVQDKYLDQTPSLIILILFIIPVLWCGSLNMKVLAKVSLSLFIISIFMIIFSASNLVMYIDFDNFKPLFNTSFFLIIKNALIFSAYFITPTFMLLITPKSMIYNSKNLDKTIIKFYLLSAINYTLIFIFVIGIFGIDLAKIFSYPEYSLMKKINYFDFIQHVENIATIQFLYCLFISNVMSIVFIKEYLKYKKIYKNSLFFIISFICLFISLNLFDNTTIGYNFIKKYYIFIYSIPLLVIVILSCIVIKIKKLS